MRPVKKSKVKSERVREIKELFDPKAARKWERDWQNELIDLEETAERDYQFAREVFTMQDVKTRGVIENMTETMGRMAGPPVYRFRGKQITEDMPRLRRIQEQRFLYWAVRILVALAEWDIQISTFKLSADKCARCGKRTKGK